MFLYQIGRVVLAASDYINTVQSMYLSYYGRFADQAGLNYWAYMLNANGGNLDNIIQAFGTSQEANTLYPATLSTAQKVTNLYNSLFGRDPDAGSLVFYTNLIGSGSASLMDIAKRVFDGATGADANQLANKVNAANNLTNTVGASTNYSGDAAAATARALMNNITNDPATITTVTNVMGAAVNSAKTTGNAITTLAGAQAVTNPINITTVNNIVGTNSDDTINITSGTNIAYGLQGNDTFNISGGTTTINDLTTNNQNDILVISGSASVTAYAAATTSLVNTSSLAATASLTILANGNNVSVATMTNNGGTMTISNASNATGVMLIGSAGVDSLIGGSGHDTITGGAGADTFIGGSGNDVFIVVSETDDAVGKSFTGGADVDEIRITGTTLVNLSDDNISSVEVLELAKAYDGSAASDAQQLIMSNAQIAALSSINGIHNRISGDTIVMNDVMTSDMLDGVDINYGVRFLLKDVAGNNLNLVDATFGVGDLLFIDGSSLTGVNSLTFNGSAKTTSTGGTEIRGGAAGDSIIGTSAVDFISGGAGSDTISGGDSHDSIIGDDGSDTLRGGDGNDTIAGSDGDDLIYGDAGDDYLTGDSGNDLIIGGEGTDTIQFGFQLVSGTAGDAAVAGGIASSIGVDTITFVVADDTFRLKESVFGLMGDGASIGVAGGTLAAAQFEIVANTNSTMVGTLDTTGNGAIVFVEAVNDLYFLEAGAANNTTLDALILAGTAIKIADITLTGSLTAADFFVQM